MALLGFGRGLVVAGLGGGVRDRDLHRGRGSATAAVGDRVGEGVRARVAGVRCVGDRAAGAQADRAVGGRTDSVDRDEVAVRVGVVGQQRDRDGLVRVRGARVVDGDRRPVHLGGRGRGVVGVVRIELVGGDLRGVGQGVRRVRGVRHRHGHGGGLTHRHGSDVAGDDVLGRGARALGARRRARHTRRQRVGDDHVGRGLGAVVDDGERVPGRAGALHGRRIGDLREPQVCPRCRHLGGDRVAGRGDPQRRLRAGEVGARDVHDVDVVEDVGVRLDPEADPLFGVDGDRPTGGARRARAQIGPHLALRVVGNEGSGVAVRRGVGDCDTVDLEAARDVGGVGRDRVEQPHARRVVLTGVLDRDGVLELVARLDGPAVDVDDGLQHVELRRVELGGEREDARVIGVRACGRLQRGGLGVVTENAAGVHAVDVDTEEVAVGEAAAADQDPVLGDRRVERVVHRVVRVGEVRAVQLQLVAGVAVVTLVADRADLRAHRARRRGLDSGDRHGRRRVGGLQHAEAVEDGEVAHRGGGVVVGDDERPTGEPVLALRGLDVGHRVGARPACGHHRRDVGEALVRRRAAGSRWTGSARRR